MAATSEYELQVLRDALAEERAIVNRIWHMFGNPKYEDLKGQSIYDLIAAAQKDAERYRWLRTAGAWESEIGMDILSESPEKFDAAVDTAIANEVKNGLAK